MINSHADKQPKQHHPATSHTAARRGHEQQDATHSLQEAAYSSPQVQQFKAYRAMANNSPQVKQLRALQAMADESVQKKSALQLPGFNSRQPVQRVVTLAMLEAKLGEDPAYGNTIDNATPYATANAVGATWVGEGAAETYYGPSGWPTLTSANRQYRPPMLKQGGAKAGEVQANYEAKGDADPDFTFNAHVTISDLDEASLAPHKKKAADEYQVKREASKKAEADSKKGDDNDEGFGFSIFN